MSVLILSLKEQVTFMNNFVFEKVKDYIVVRDDMFKGGTKKRAFERIVDTIDEDEFVYACDYYGHAAYAIALTAQTVNKKVKLFYYSPKRETDIFFKTTALDNVSYEIIDEAKTQVEVSKYAKEYATESNARFFTIGLDFLKFNDALFTVVKSAQIKAPEIWCMGGSGSLARSLQKAYPTIPVNVVSVGTSNANFEGVAKVFDAPELLDEEAEVPPPYTSSPNYDAKTWRFVLDKAKPGSVIWNVA